MSINLSPVSHTPHIILYFFSEPPHRALTAKLVLYKYDQLNSNQIDGKSSRFVTQHKKKRSSFVFEKFLSKPIYFAQKSPPFLS